MSAAETEWVMPTSWENLSRDELEHAVRNGWVRNVGQAVEMIYAAGQMAAYYAWGRLDQGHPQVVPKIDAEGVWRTHSDDVRCFKTLYERAKRDEFAGANYMPAVQTAWESYVASGGTTLTYMVPTVVEDGS